MFSRHANPHAVLGELAPVRRSRLWDDEEEGTSAASSLTPAGKEFDSSVARLNLLIEGSIHVDLTRPGPSPKKKSKTKASNDKSVFRIFAGEPKVISLAPPAEIKGRPLERASEDTEEEATIRHKQAADVAIDGPETWVCYPTQDRPALRSTRSISASFHGSPPSLAIVEKLTGGSKAKPPSTTAGLKSIAHIFAASATPSAFPVPTKRKRRPRKAKVARAQPSFFKAPPEWGGKSLGYALGY